MISCADSSKAEYPTIQSGDSGSIPTSALHSLRIFVASIREIRAFVETHHYSHNLNGVKITHCFRVMQGDVLVGAVVFGAMSTTAWRKFSATESSVLELRRLVLLDCAGKNSESRVIGWCLRWIKKNSTEVDTIVSYADPKAGHSGTIYRASNFSYAGKSLPDIGYKDRETGKVYHSRALRTRNSGGDFKPFVKRLREKLSNGLLEKIPLPGKHCFIYRLRP